MFEGTVYRGVGRGKQPGMVPLLRLTRQREAAVVTFRGTQIMPGRKRAGA